MQTLTGIVIGEPAESAFVITILNSDRIDSLKQKVSDRFSVSPQHVDLFKVNDYALDINSKILAGLNGVQNIDRFQVLSLLPVTFLENPLGRIGLYFPDHDSEECKLNVYDDKLDFIVLVRKPNLSSVFNSARQSNTATLAASSPPVYVPYDSQQQQPASFADVGNINDNNLYISRTTVPETYVKSNSPPSNFTLSTYQNTSPANFGEGSVIEPKKDKSVYQISRKKLIIIVAVVVILIIIGLAVGVAVAVTNSNSVKSKEQSSIGFTTTTARTTTAGRTTSIVNSATTTTLSVSPIPCVTQVFASTQFTATDANARCTEVCRSWSPNAFFLQFDNLVSLNKGIASCTCSAILTAVGGCSSVRGNLTSCFVNVPAPSPLFNQATATLVCQQGCDANLPSSKWNKNWVGALDAQGNSNVCGCEAFFAQSCPAA